MENRTPAEQSGLLHPGELLGLLSKRKGHLEVEIGCGNGHFLVEYCRMHPSSLFIGVEIKNRRCLKAQAKIERQQLNNARIVHGSAENALTFLPDESVNGFHLYFPDPWPKSRHRRRRFLRRENIGVLQRKLKVGGFIYFATDYFDYFLHSKVLLLLQEGIELIQRTPNESIFRSAFAQRFLEKGKQIRTLTAQKIR